VARSIRLLSTVLLTAGLVLLLDVGLTLAWREPVSNLHGWLAQREAADELAELGETFAGRRVTAPDGGADLRAVERAADSLAAKVGDGDAIGRMTIAAIDLKIVLLEGTDTATLQDGPGHYPATAFPGQPGTVAVAGHRTTYLAPFRDLDRLDAGDEVTIEMPYADFTYRFEKVEIVEPSETRVVRDVGYDRLVLTACNPIYSAAERIVVTSRLVEVDPPGREGGTSATGSADEPDAISGPGLGPSLAALGGVVLIAALMWIAAGSAPRRRLSSAIGPE